MATPTRAEFERLKAECERLRDHVEVLREQMQVFAKDAKIQFERMAQMQAILDEESRHDRGGSSRHAQSPRTGDGPVVSTVPDKSHRRGRSVG